MPNQIKETSKTNQISMQSNESFHSAWKKELTRIVRLVDLSSDWLNKQHAHSGLFNNFDNEAKGVMGSCLIKVYLVCVCVCPPCRRVIRCYFSKMYVLSYFSYFIVCYSTVCVS